MSLELLNNPIALFLEKEDSSSKGWQSCLAIIRVAKNSHAIAI